MSSEAEFLAALHHCDSLFEANDLTSASKAFEQLTQDWPNQVEAWNCLGFVYILQKRFENAVRVLTRGLNVSPLHRATRTNLAIACRNLGDNERAIPLLLDLVLETDKSEREQLLTLLTDSLAQTSDERLVRSTFGALLEEFTHDTQMISLAIRHFEKLSLWDDCIPLYRRVLETNLENDFIQEKLAYALFASGNEEEAKREFSNLLSSRSFSSTQAEQFHLHYNAGLMATGTKPSPKRRRRFNMLINIFRDTLALQGEIAECGVYRGLSAYVLCQTLRDILGSYNGDNFHSFDSFEGLSEPTSEDRASHKQKNSMRAGEFRCDLETVSQNLREFPQIKFYKGWIPERFPEVTHLQFRFVHIDVDLYEPSRDALEFFFPRLVQDGIIVCDDFNWAGQEKAVRDFCAMNSLEFAITDANQAIIRRP